MGRCPIPRDGQRARQVEKNVQIGPGLHGGFRGRSLCLAIGGFHHNAPNARSIQRRVCISTQSPDSAR